MAIGIMEGIIGGLIILGFVAIFGRTTAKKILKMVMGGENLIDEVKREVAEEKKAFAEKKAQA